MVAVQSTQCFTQQELAEFAAGSISVEQLDSIAAHVDTCAMCQATVSGLDDQPDSFVRDLRELPDDRMGEESACQAVVRRLMDHHSTSPPGAPDVAEVPDSIGGYRVLEPVGTGGMGIVYKAQHPKLKRLVAIKLLPVQRWAGPAAVARFEREMEVSGGLDHPNIVRASDAGEESGMHYLVMDYVDGLDLSRLVRRMGPLPVSDACEVVRQAALGLAHVHGTGLVHRDIKPSNVMVTQDGRVKILDLGLAMLGEQYLEGENNLTTIGQLMGTLDYMAPEQAADSHQIDARADVYSLGATLFHMLTGHAPYGGAGYNSLLKKVIALANAPVPSAAATRKEVPAQLDGVIGRCLAKDPAQRYATVKEVAEALAPFVEAHDLVNLMKQAASKPESNRFRHATWSMAAVLGAQKEPTNATKQTAASGGGKRFDALKQLLGAAAAFALIVLAVMVVRIATDRGELLIRSEDPNARILIKRVDGKAVKELTVEQGKGKTTIRSGQYEVELLSNADRMMIDKRQFIISRGDKVLLTVQERLKRGAMGMGSEGGEYMEYGDEGYSAGGDMYGSSMGADTGSRGGSMAGGSEMGDSMMAPGMGSGAGMMSGERGMSGYEDEEGGYGDVEYGEGEMSDSYGGEMEGDYGEDYGYGDYDEGEYGGMGGYLSASEALKARLVYDDKSYNDWMKILKTERNPERLIEAVKAIAVLAPEGGSDEAAAALLRAMRAYGTTVADSGGGSQMPGGKLGQQVLYTLLYMEPSAVAKGIDLEIEQGNTNSRQFLYLFVSTLYDSDSEPVVNRLTTALRQAAPEIMPDLIKLSQSSDLNLSRWAVTFASALTAVAQLDIHKYEGLEPLLQKALKSKDDQTVLLVAVALSRVAPETEGLTEALLRLASQPAHQVEALQAIGRFGPDARFAVGTLLDILTKEAETIAEKAPGPGYGMDGGYGMGGPGQNPYSDPLFNVLRVLEQMEGNASEAVPVLRKLAESKSPYWNQARQILKKYYGVDYDQHSDDSEATPEPADNPFGDGER